MAFWEGREGGAGKKRISLEVVSVCLVCSHGYSI